MEFVINGERIKMLFRFSIGEKNYVAYLTKDEEISASELIEEGSSVRLEKIVSDKEWEEVEKEIEKRLE